jgi:hypothetical protein
MPVTLPESAVTFTGIRSSHLNGFKRLLCPIGHGLHPLPRRMAHMRHLGGLLACCLAPNGAGRGVLQFDSQNQSKKHGTGYATRNKRARYISVINLLNSLLIAPASGVKKPNLSGWVCCLGWVMASRHQSNGAKTRGKLTGPSFLCCGLRLVFDA